MQTTLSLLSSFLLQVSSPPLPLHWQSLSISTLGLVHGLGCSLVSDWFVSSHHFFLFSLVTLSLYSLSHSLSLSLVSFTSISLSLSLQPIPPPSPPHTTLRHSLLLLFLTTNSSSSPYFARTFYAVYLPALHSSRVLMILFWLFTARTQPVLVPLSHTPARGFPASSSFLLSQVG